MTTAIALNLDHLLTARLVVARYGEMDVAKWWNTKGVLGRMGATLYGRGMPRTHLFAQARVVFEVAAVRCREVYQLPDAITLWNLPAEVEDSFHDRWHHWIAEQAKWQPLFAKLEAITGGDLIAHLAAAGAITDTVRERVGALRRAADGRAVPVGKVTAIDDHAISLLAAGFARGESGKLAVPYVKVDAA
jgi:hypothetical protein